METSAARPGTAAYPSAG